MELDKYLSRYGGGGRQQYSSLRKPKQTIPWKDLYLAPSVASAAPPGTFAHEHPYWTDTDVPGDRWEAWKELYWKDYNALHPALPPMASPEPAPGPAKPIGDPSVPIHAPGGQPINIEAAVRNMIKVVEERTGMTAPEDIIMSIVNADPHKRIELVDDLKLMLQSRDPASGAMVVFDRPQDFGEWLESSWHSLL